MATLNFNATEVTPSSTLEPIPAGKYQAVIVESELKMTKSGTGSYLELTFEIISGEFAKRRLWARLNIRNSNPKAVEIAQRDLSAICYAINVLHPQDSSELHDKLLTVTVRCVKNLDTGDIQNEIKGYSAPVSVSGVQTAPPAAAPVKSAPAGAPWAR